MKIRMLASATLMPEFRLLVEGEAYEIPPEQGARLCESGLAVPVPASAETAMVQPSEVAAKAPPAGTRRAATKGGRP